MANLIDANNTLYNKKSLHCIISKWWEAGKKKMPTSREDVVVVKSLKCVLCGLHACEYFIIKILIVIKVMDRLRAMEAEEHLLQNNNQAEGNALRCCWDAFCYNYHIKIITITSTLILIECWCTSLMLIFSHIIFHTFIILSLNFL